MKQGNNLSALSLMQRRWLAIITVLIIGACSQERPRLVEGKAHSYRVIRTADYSFPGRKRVRRVIVSPNAKSFADRAVTGIQAAKDLRESADADQASIWLELHEDLTGSGLQLALVTYTPDGKGNSGEDDGPVWEVESSGIQPSQQEVEVAVEWQRHRDEFRDATGLVDEEKLREYLSENLGLPLQDLRELLHVRLILGGTEDFPYDGEEYEVVGQRP